MADSSSPRLAAYYNGFLALCGNTVYAWRDYDRPQEQISGIKQVGVGKANRYALSKEGELFYWRNKPRETTELLDKVSSFSAGRSGLLVIRNDSSLWKFETRSLLSFGEEVSDTPKRIASNVLTATVGDSADYYLTRDGALFVNGLAHRGQYGDGKLTSTEDFVQTSNDVVNVVAHTGHALLLKRDGTVWGTGGNIYGPLGKHGFGDKADEWGFILDGVSAIATGGSHSLAIKPDRSLWIWGRNESLEPRQVMREVDAVAGSSNSTVVLSRGVLWQWDTGNDPEKMMECPD